MKTLKTLALLAALFTCFVQTSAQGSVPLNVPDYNKPKIFADLPYRIPVRVAVFEDLLSNPLGRRVEASLVKGFSVLGTVISQSTPVDKRVKSIVVKLANRQGATLTITRITETDGSFTYSGRMLHKSGGDALELVKEGEQYVFRKMSIYDLLNE